MSFEPFDIHRYAGKILERVVARKKPVRRPRVYLEPEKPTHDTQTQELITARPTREPQS